MRPDAFPSEVVTWVRAWRTSTEWRKDGAEPCVSIRWVCSASGTRSFNTPSSEEGKTTSEQSHPTMTNCQASAGRATG